MQIIRVAETPRDCGPGEIVAVKQTQLATGCKQTSCVVLSKSAVGESAGKLKIFLKFLNPYGTWTNVH